MPRAAADWRGVRNATQYAASGPQNQSPFVPPGPQSEDSLYLNVSTPTLREDARKPVIVWIHGGGLTIDGARNYDATKLAAEGTVVVTLNYRLGLLGVLAHPSLAKSDGSTGNYGLMDQQAALRWVRHNIARFGGDPRNVTIAGQSAGGLAVLAHMVSRDSRGLFQRAIVMSGAFALKQQSLATAKAQSQALLAKAGVTDQSAAALRKLPAEDLVKALPGAAIPGVVDGKVLTESIGKALAAGRFAHVPVMNGIVHDENRLFVGLGAPVVNGSNVPLPEPVTAESYQRVIASVLGVPAERAAAIAADYPLDAYPSPTAAFSAVVSDAGFAHGALKLNRWAAKYAPVYAYEFDDDSAPQRFAPPGFLAPIATHSSDVQYLFDLPNTPFKATLNPGRRARGQHARGLGGLRRRQGAMAAIRLARAGHVVRHHRIADRDGRSPRTTTRTSRSERGLTDDRARRRWRRAFALPVGSLISHRVLGSAACSSAQSSA